MRRLLALLCAASLSLVIAPAALASTPTNDEQAGATVVTVTPDVPFTTTQDTTEATVAASDPLRTVTSEEYPYEWTVPIGPTVWYVFTAGATGAFAIELAGTTYTPMLLVTDEALTVLNWTTDGTVLDAVEGQTYYFVIGDEDPSDGLGGALSLSVSWVPPTPPDPVPVDAQIAVTGASIVDGQLVVTGTLTATGDYSSSVLEVVASQSGKLPATGVMTISDPGTEWTVSVPPAIDSPNWGALRTTLTVHAYFYLDTTEYPVGSSTYVATVRLEQAAPPPAPELGSVSGRFTVIDDLTGRAVNFVVDLQRVSPEWDTAPTGSLGIKSGGFAGRYEPAVLNLYEVDGGSMAMIGVVMPDSGRMNVELWAFADGSRSVEITVLDAGFNVVDSMTGTVSKKGFTITMPTP